MSEPAVIEPGSNLVVDQSVTPPATPEPTPEPQLTQEELRARESEFIEDHFSDSTVPKKKPEPAAVIPPVTQSSTPEPEKKDEKQVDVPSSEPLDALDPDGEKTAATDKKTTPAAIPAPTPTPSVQPVIDHEAIAESVAARLEKKPAPPAPENPFAQFSEDDQERLRVLQHLEQTSDRYKGSNIVKRTADFFKAEGEYRAAWQKENPGKKYEPGSDEHNDFYTQNEPAISSRDIDTARIDMHVKAKIPAIVDEQVKQRVAPIEAQARQAQREALENRIQPALAQAANGAIVELITEAVPEFKELIPDGRLTSASLAKMREKDPEAIDLVNEEARRLKVLISECEAMIQMGDYYVFDEKKVISTKSGNVAPCAEFVRVGTELESQWLQKPEAERVRDGKRFITTDAYGRMLELAGNDPRKLNLISSQYFIVPLEDIRREFVRQSAKNVRTVLDVANKRVERSIKKNGHQPANGAQPGTTQEPAKPAKTTPPSTPGSSEMVDTKIPTAPGGMNPEQTFAAEHFR